MIKFVYGLSTAYAALSPKDENALYFLTDTKQIYKGSTLVSDCNIRFVETEPTAATAEEGMLYVCVKEGKSTLWVKSGETIIQAGGGEATAVANGILKVSNFNTDAIATEISADAASATKIPTEAAVANFVKTTVESVKTQLDGRIDDAIVNVEVGPSATTGKFNLNFYKSATPTSNPISVELDKEQYLLDAKVETRTIEEVETQCLILTVQVLDETGAATSREVVIPLSDLVQVDASTVKTTKEITLTTTWGLLTPGTKIPVNDIQSILISALSKDINPTVTAPAISSVSLSNAGAKEVGTAFTPSYTVNYTDGTYNLLVDGTTNKTNANCTATEYNVTDTDGNTASTRTGSFNEFTVTESTNYHVSATVSYSQGEMPKTYLGSDYPSIQIAAGTTPSKTSANVTGYRAFFWGYKTAAQVIADPTVIDTTQVRALGNAGRAFPATLTTTGMQQIFFACPANTYNTCTVINSTNGAPQTVKKQAGIQVQGANGYAAAAYDVFYVSNAGAEGGTTKYNLTFSK